jgi:hypothetical protein
MAKRKQKTEIKRIVGQIASSRTPSRSRLQGTLIEGSEVLPSEHDIVLDLHLGYTGGKLRPVTHDGITFYIVGHNASHEFYLGHDAANRLWKMSSGEQDCDADGTPIFGEHLSLVEDFQTTYIGHL